LWRAVVTPWGPTVIYVRSTDQISMLATTWTDGIPIDVPTENLSALTWNPRNILTSLGEVEGLADAKRIAVDGMSAGMAKVFFLMAPNATLVDGDAFVSGLRAVKMPGEVHAIRTAIALSEGILAGVIDQVAPGVTESHLKGLFHDRMGVLGINHTSVEPIVCASPMDGSIGDHGAPIRQFSTDRALRPGELVSVTGSVQFGGYEGAVARTVPCLGPTGSPSDGQGNAYHRWQAATDAVAARCVPGTHPMELRRAWESTGEALPPVPVAHGIGLGVEQPMVGGVGGPDPLDRPLEQGMVLAVGGYVWEPGVGGYLGTETVLVTDGAPERLTNLSHRPLAG
jgi:Xaa-Pro aminopeptidase